MITDLDKAFTVLAGKTKVYSTLFQYADGDQPLQYSTSRLREAFDNMDARFSQNWCSVVIDSALDRVTFNGWATQDKKVTQQLSDIFNEYEITMDAYDIHRAASITSESYAIVWKNESGEIEFNYNDPRMCHVFYKSDNPKMSDFACKWYREGKIYHIILYYTDRLEYYETAEMKSVPTSSKAFKPSELDRADNPYNEIPVFHFFLSRNSKGDLFNIITLQDAVNKLFSDMMVAAEFCALPQRYVISDAETSTLKNAANEIWALSEGSSAGSFPAANLDNFLNAIDKIANSIAIISRTPKHYFYSGGGEVSGEALLAMEAPLTKKVDQRIASFSNTWKKIAVFLLKLNGNDTLSGKDIVAVWEPAYSVQPKTEAETVKTWIEAGVPLRTAVSNAGWTDDKIADLEKDKLAEKNANAALGAELLNRARINNEQSNEQSNQSNLDKEN